MGIDGLKNTPNLIRREQTGSATANIDSANLLMRLAPTHNIDFPHKRRYKRLNQGFQMSVGVKGTIGAFDGAKWNVQIQRQGERG